MTTSQIVHKLEALEERMGARELPPPKITIDYVESCDGRPTGKITRVHWVGEEKIREETLQVDPATLRGR
jgi:hypothetical protein